MFGRYWIVFKAMGIAAFHSTEEPFRYSWLSLLSGYCLALTSVSAVSSLLAIMYSNHTYSFTVGYKKSQTAEIVLLLDKVTLLLTSVVCLLSGTYQTKKLFHIMNKFEHDRALKNYTNVSKKRFKEGISLGLFLVSLMVGELVYSRNYSTHLPVLYLRLFMFVYIFMFSSTVLTLYGMFRNLNRKLNEILGFQDLGPVQVLPLVDYLRGLSNKSVKSVDTLRELSAVHWKLCTIGCNVNEAFNGQLMALFISVVVRIVTRPYFIFLSVEHSTTAVDPIYVCINTGWVLVYWLQLCLLVWSCSIASNEVIITIVAGKTTTVLVHNLNKPLSAENRKPMEMFLLQLANHKLDFTVYDLFTIDLTVLTSVAGAVTTYLVILIQFQNSH